LLVVGEGRRDGILVNPEGGSYARYSAFMPNVEAFLSVGRYPALKALNKKLVTMVDTIAGQAGVATPDGRGVVNLNDWGEMLNIDFATNNTLRSTVLEMLNNRAEIRDWELDKNELIVWRKLDDVALSAENISDPSTTLTDMYAYGYTWDGMIPLGKERALELFDAGHEIFSIYENDVEGVVRERGEIEGFEGLYGIENPAWVKTEQAQPLQVFIINREKYDNSEAVGEWLTLPADADTLRGLFERIGIEKPSEGAFTITAVRVPFEGNLRDHVSKYDSLDELNMLASYLDSMEDYEIEKLQAILTTGIADVGVGVSALINLVDADNFDAFDYLYADNEEALGRYYADENDEKPDDVSFEEYGRLCVKNEGGVFINGGYIKHMHKEVGREYDGVVPAEYKIVGDALRGLQPKKPERGSEHGAGEKPSVMDEIKASRRGSHAPKNKPASTSQEKGTQKSKKRKGGPDL